MSIVDLEVEVVMVMVRCHATESQARICLEARGWNVGAAVAYYNSTFAGNL